MNEIIDRLVISFADLDASKSEFRNYIARKLNILPSDVTDIWLETVYRGTIHQYLYVSLNERLTKQDLDKLDFDYIDITGDLVFDLGEVRLSIDLLSMNTCEMILN